MTSTGAILSFLVFAGLGQPPIIDPKPLPEKPAREWFVGASELKPQVRIAAADEVLKIKCPVGRYVPVFIGPKAGATVDLTDPDGFKSIRLPRGTGHSGQRYDREEVDYDPLADDKTQGPVFVLIAQKAGYKTRVQLWKNGGDEGPSRSLVAEIETTGVKKDDVVIDDAKPLPKPIPPDPKPIPPDPKPTPVVYTGELFLVVVEETGEAKANRGDFFNDKDLVGYLAKRLSRRPRIADIDTKDKDNATTADLKPYFEIAAARVKEGKKLPFFFVVAPDGELRLMGPVPDKPAEFKAVLQKHFGG